MDTVENKNDKFIETPTEQGSPRFTHIFVYNKPDGGTGAINYTPELDENGVPKPLTQQSFYESLQNADTKRYTTIADSTQVPVQILQGIAKVEADRQSIEQKDRRVKSFDLFRFNDDTNKKYGPLASVEPSVVEEAGDEVPSKENSPSYAAAVAAHLAANILDSQNITDRNNLSNEQLGAAYREYVKQSSGRIATDEETASFVNEVRSYKADRRFVPSAQLPKDAFDGKAVQRYNSIIRYSKANQTFDDWYNDRGAVRGFWNADTSSTFAWLQRAIDLFTNPEQQFNTMLSDKEEKKFQDWFKDMQDKGMIAETDTGFDYDFRGAFKDGYKPVKQSDDKYHWTDKYKKPNHVTFSKESKYAEGLWAQYAGSWSTDKNGNVKYTPSNIQYPHAEQQLYYDMTKDLEKTVVTSHDETYDPGSAELKRAKQRGLKLKIGGMTTGMAADIDTELIAMAGVQDFSTVEYIDTGAMGEPIDPAKGNVYTRPYALTDFPKDSEFFIYASRQLPITAKMDPTKTKGIAGDVKRLTIDTFIGVNPTVPVISAERARNYMKYNILPDLAASLASDEVVIDVTRGVVTSGEGVIKKKELAKEFIERYKQSPYQTLAWLYKDELGGTYTEFVQAYEQVGKLSMVAEYNPTPQNQEKAKQAMDVYNSARRRLWREGQVHLSVYTHLDPRILELEDVDTAMNLASGNGGDIQKDHAFYKKINNYTIDAPDMAYVLAKNIHRDGNQELVKGLSSEELNLRIMAVSHMAIFNNSIDGLNRIIQGQSWYQISKDVAMQKDVARIYAEAQLNRRIKKLASPDKLPNGQQTTFAVMAKDLAPLLAALAYKDEKMKIGDAKKNIDGLIDTYAKHFITSDKYGESITRAEQLDYGIEDARQLDGILKQATDATMVAARAGKLGIHGASSFSAETQAATIAENESKLRLFIMDGQICPYYIDMDGNMQRVVEKDGGAPFSISLDSMVKADAAATFAGEQITKRYGNIWLNENIRVMDDTGMLVRDTKFIASKQLPRHSQEIVNMAKVLLPRHNDQVLGEILPGYTHIYNRVMEKAKADLYSSGQVPSSATNAQVDKAVADSFREIFTPSIEERFSSAHYAKLEKLRAMSPAELEAYLADEVSSSVAHRMHPTVVEGIEPLVPLWEERLHKADPYKYPVAYGYISKEVTTRAAKNWWKRRQTETQEGAQERVQQLQDYMKGGK